MAGQKRCHHGRMSVARSSNALLGLVIAQLAEMPPRRTTRVAGRPDQEQHATLIDGQCMSCKILRGFACRCLGRSSEGDRLNSPQPNWLDRVAPSASRGPCIPHGSYDWGCGLCNASHYDQLR